MRCCVLGRSGTVVAGSYDHSLRVWRLPLHVSVNNWKSNMITKTNRILHGKYSKANAVPQNVVW